MPRRGAGLSLRDAGLPRVIESLGRDGLVDRGRQAPVPQVIPQSLATLWSGMDLDLHGHLLGYSGWR